MDGPGSLCAPTVTTFDLSQFSTSYRFPCSPRRLALPSIDPCYTCSPHGARHPPPLPVPPLHGCCPCHRSMAREFVCNDYHDLPEAPIYIDNNVETITRNIGPGQYVPPSLPMPDGIARPASFIYRPRHPDVRAVPPPLQPQPLDVRCVSPGARVKDYRVVMQGVDAYDDRDLPRFNPPATQAVRTERPYWAPCQSCAWQSPPKYTCGRPLAQKPYPTCREMPCWSTRFPISCEDPPYKREWNPPLPNTPFV